MYGLYPQKGSIGIGFDADLVVWILDAASVAAGDHEARVRLHSLMKGLAVTGYPVMTILRGTIAMEEGRIHAEAGQDNSSDVACLPTPSPDAGRLDNGNLRGKNMQGARSVLLLAGDRPLSRDRPPLQCSPRQM